jgi:flagellum-specific ATP synthase
MEAVERVDRAANELLGRLRTTGLVAATGRITRVMPTFLEGDGPLAPVGTVCNIHVAGRDSLQAEIVGIDPQRVVLMPYGPVHGVLVGDSITAHSGAAKALVGDALLGRAVNALGQPIDGGGSVAAHAARPLYGARISPLDRLSRTAAVETGIKAIDGALTLGVGQRVGIFAGSGVGKTTLLNSIARNVQADVRVVCLVGERGREAAEFWNDTLTPDLRRNSIQVVSTSDDPAVVRARAVHYAAAIAEYFRDQGRHVVFFLDSLTRLAMALREVGLAVGEPPTLRAYTPSVFATLPRVVERFGAVRDKGAITAFLSVLTEGDDVDDPLAETVKALLDGHIVLSRELAEQGQFPAVNLQRSVSRFFRLVAEPNHQAVAGEVIAQMATYEASRSLVESGLYKAGSNTRLDKTLAARETLMAFLRQGPADCVGLKATVAGMTSIVGAGRAQ